MAEKKDSIRTLIDTGRRIGKLTSSEISDVMEENGNVLDVEAMKSSKISSITSSGLASGRSILLIHTITERFMSRAFCKTNFV